MKIEEKKEGILQYLVASFHPEKEELTFEREGKDSIRVGNLVLKGNFNTEKLDGHDTVFGLKSDNSPYIETIDDLEESDFMILTKGCPEIIRNGALNIRYDQATQNIFFVPQKHLGIGYNRKGEVLLVFCKDNLTTKQFAQLMLEMGCERAIRIDGEMTEEKHRKKKKQKNKGAEKNGDLSGN